MRSIRAITFSTLALALAFAVGVAGCGSDRDPNDPANFPTDLTLFIGTWNVAAAQLNTTCTDMGGGAFTVNQPTTLVMGSTSDLVDNDATCPVLYDVTGRIARALPDQFCDNPDLPSRMYIMEDTFVVDGEGMASHEASGKLDGFINITLGESVKCTFTETGLYRRPTP